MTNTVAPPNRNTPKISDAANNGVLSSTYKILKFDLTNSENITKSIISIVKEFSITEELFSPINVLNIRIYDDVNFFEEMKLGGQEKISLKLEIKSVISGSTNSSTNQTVDNGTSSLRTETYEYTFAVKEYPNYQKDINSQSAQEYNMICIPTYAYLSALTRISRAISGAVIDNIKNILKNDLYLGNSKTDETIEVIGTPITAFEGIITIQSPLKAVEWLRSKMYDDISSPFFVYRPLRHNKIHIHGWTNIIEEKPYRTYKYLPHLKNSAVNSAQESSNRIYNLKSAIKMDKLAQALGGGFSTKLQLTNITKKTMTEKTLNYAESVAKKITSKLNPLTSYIKSIVFLNDNNSEGKKDEKSLNTYSNANIKNAEANTASPNSLSADDVIDNLILQQSLVSRLESRNQEIEVNGDMYLNPAQKLDMQIGRMYNPKRKTESEEISTKYATWEKDEGLSGIYVIGVAAHTFKEGLYRTRLKVFDDI
jgi:hypothetical protein